MVYNQGIIWENFKESMHHSLMAKIKTGAINSSFLTSDIVTSMHACPVYMFQCGLLGANNVWSLNLAYPDGCF